MTHHHSTRSWNPQRLRYLATIFACLLAAIARPARADVASCSSAHESGQQAAHAGKLRKAVADFTTCAADDACPDVIRKDCMSLRDEASAALPTVTFAVTDGVHEMTGARIFSDEEPLADGIDGRALPLDPGRHRLRVVLPHGRVVVSDIMLHEGEKNRLITVQTGDVTPPSRSPDTAASDRASPGGRVLPASFWLASGLGLSAIAVGTTFALLGRAEEQRVLDCAPRCPTELHANLDRARRDYLIGNIAFGVAGASVASAILLYVTAPSTATKPPPVVSSLRLRQLSVAPAGRGLQASASFTFQAL